MIDTAGHTDSARTRRVFDRHCPATAQTSRRARKEKSARRLVAAAIAFVSLAAIQDARATFTFPRFGELARIAGATSTDVRCESIDEWANDPIARENRLELWAYVADFGTPSAHAMLSPRICLGLLWLDHDPADLTTSRVNRIGAGTVLGEETRAIFILAHEAQHLRGIRDETDADCGALAALPQLVATLDVPPGRAKRILDGARILHLTAPPQYQTHPC
jgi:hypothetical protein